MRAQASGNETERNEMESGELMRQLAEQAQSAGEKAHEREIGKEVEGKNRVEGEVELERERALFLGVGLQTYACQVQQENARNN